MSDKCEAVVKKTIDEFGKVDILVNGAGGNFMAAARRLSSNAFKRVQEIDQLGTFNMSREVYNQSMRSNRSGVIINIGA